MDETRRKSTPVVYLLRSFRNDMSVNSEGVTVELYPIVVSA